MSKNCQGSGGDDDGGQAITTQYHARRMAAEGAYVSPDASIVRHMGQPKLDLQW